MQIDEDVFQLLSDVIAKNGWIDLPAKGSSMFPFIRQGNICRFIPCEISGLRSGDVLLYRSSDGQLVAHRVHRVRACSEGWQLICKGDSNLGYDRPVRLHQSIGRLQYVRKQKITLDMKHPLIWVWSRCLLWFPQISWLLNAYLKRTMGFTYDARRNA